MPSLKDLRNRIASTKATQKITKAMQMVAASKLRRAQNAAEAARPYAEKMDAVISNIATAAAASPGAPVLMSGTGKDQVHLLIAVTADRGLAGAFNTAIGRATRTLARSLEARGKNVKILAVGRWTPKATADGVRPVLPAEVRDTVRLYLDGVIDQWFIQQDNSGVVFLLNVTETDKARALLEKLPLGQAGLMEFQLTQLGPVSPLASLIGAPAK